MVMREVKLCKTLSTPSILFSILLVTYYNIKNIIKAYIPITGVMDTDSKWGGGGGGGHYIPLMSYLQRTCSW